MTTQTQNNILVGAYIFFAGCHALSLFAVILLLIFDNDKPISQVRPEQWLVMAILTVILSFCLLQLLTAYGLWRKRAWARKAALVLSTIVIWYFPLGTALWIYTRWFLRSQDGQELYAKGYQSKSQR